MSLLERLNHAFSGGIMFVQPTAETYKQLEGSRESAYLRQVK